MSVCVMSDPLVDDDTCSRGHATPTDILFSAKTTGLCVGCGKPICTERLAVVPDATKCAKCQVADDEDAFYVMEASLSGSEGKTSNVPVRMDEKTYRSKYRRPGYGSNLRLGRS
jgi:hypothetical protein